MMLARNWNPSGAQFLSPRLPPKQWTSSAGSAGCGNTLTWQRFPGFYSSSSITTDGCRPVGRCPALKLQEPLPGRRFPTLLRRLLNHIRDVLPLRLAVPLPHRRHDDVARVHELLGDSDELRTVRVLLAAVVPDDRR